MRLTRC